MGGWQWGITNRGRLDVLLLVCVCVVRMCFSQQTFGNDSCISSYMHLFIFRLYPLFLSSTAPPTFPSSHSIALWRGTRIIHSDMVWCFWFIFSCAHCWALPLTHTISHSFLNSSLYFYFFHHHQRKGGSVGEYCMIWGAAIMFAVRLWQSCLIRVACFCTFACFRCECTWSPCSLQASTWFLHYTVYLSSNMHNISLSKLSSLWFVCQACSVAFSVVSSSDMTF